jgi:hypothetical protein
LLLPFVVGNLVAGTSVAVVTFLVLRSVLARRRLDAAVRGHGPEAGAR